MFISCTEPTSMCQEVKVLCYCLLKMHVIRRPNNVVHTVVLEHVLKNWVILLYSVPVYNAVFLRMGLTGSGSISGPSSP